MSYATATVCTRSFDDEEGEEGEEDDEATPGTAGEGQAAGGQQQPPECKQQ